MRYAERMFLKMSWYFSYVFEVFGNKKGFESTQISEHLESPKMTKMIGIHPQTLISQQKNAIQPQQHCKQFGNLSNDLEISPKGQK